MSRNVQALSLSTGVRPCKTGCGRLTWYESKQLCGICGRPNAKVCEANDCTRVARPNGLCWKHEQPKPKPTCSTPGCDRDVDSRGLCLMHYRRARKAGTIPARSCIVDGCTRPRMGRGLCNTHWASWRRGSGHV